MRVGLLQKKFVCRLLKVDSSDLLDGNVSAVRLDP